MSENPLREGLRQRRTPEPDAPVMPAQLHPSALNTDRILG